MGVGYIIIRLSQRKAALQMSTDKEILMIQKATVLDLLILFKENPDKT